MVEYREPNVGSRLREIREKQGLSLRVLAERCGLSINAISQIERGGNSPTISSLHRLATGLNVPITSLFQDGTEQSVVFVKHNLGLVSQSDSVVMESLGIGLNDQQLEPFRVTVKPGAGNTDDPISHSGQEFVYCLEGEIDYLVGDQVYRLEWGDSLLFDATQAHAYHNPTQHKAVLLLVFQPVGDRHALHRLHLDI